MKIMFYLRDTIVNKRLLGKKLTLPAWAEMWMNVRAEAATEKSYLKLETKKRDCSF